MNVAPGGCFGHYAVMRSARILKRALAKVFPIAGLRLLEAELGELRRQNREYADRLAVLDEQIVSAPDWISALGRNAHFLSEPKFAAAWDVSAKANEPGWPEGVPDIRWRAHIALWAARNGASLEGDFVECGVHTGLLSLVICHAMDFADQPRRFFLFDTFDGIPLDRLSPSEHERAEHLNTTLYRDVHHAARQNFAPFPNAILVRGVLPESLEQAELGAIAYLSVDLNMAPSERAVIEALWDRIVPGAAILIDDYDWKGHEAQRDVWNRFAAERHQNIATLPTGQGLMIKR